MNCQTITQAGDTGRARVDKTSTCSMPSYAHISTTHVETGIAAQMLLVQPQTLLKSHSQNGCYGPIRPIRLPSRKLAWPLAQIEKVLRALDVSEPK